MFRKTLRREGIRNFLKLFSSSLLAQGLSLALSPLFARLFTPNDFGLVALYLGIFSVLSVLATAKYEQAIMLPRSDQAARSLFWLVQMISLAFALFVLLAVLLGGGFITTLSGNASLRPWLWFLPLSLLMHGLFQGATFYANRHKKFGVMAGSTLLHYSVLNGTRVVTGLLQTAFNGLLGAQIMAQVGSTFYMIMRSARKLFSPDDALSLERISHQARIYSGYPRYNMLLNFTNNLSGALPIFMFTRGFSAEVAGLYAFGYTFVFRPLSLFSQSTLQVLSQKIIEDYHQGRYVYPALKKLVLRFFALGIIPFTLLAIFAPAVFRLVFTEEYLLAGRFLQVLSPWLFAVFLTSPLSFVPELFFHQKKAMIIDIVLLVLRFLALWAGIW
ncbi:MAG: oligosaccharide flippase family protein, partial [Bacteroidales bacterium]|nr:oligosaccharide flippase family protein [Bacteroidales bacterium]